MIFSKIIKKDRSIHLKTKVLSKIYYKKYIVIDLFLEHHANCSDDIPESQQCSVSFS